MIFSFFIIVFFQMNLLCLIYLKFFFTLIFVCLEIYNVHLWYYKNTIYSWSEAYASNYPFTFINLIKFSKTFKFKEVVLFILILATIKIILVIQIFFFCDFVFISCFLTQKQRRFLYFYLNESSTVVKLLILNPYCYALLLLNLLITEKPYFYFSWSVALLNFSFIQVFPGSRWAVNVTLAVINEINNTDYARPYFTKINFYKFLIKKIIHNLFFTSHKKVSLFFQFFD